MIKIVINGTVTGTRFYDEQGVELTALRKSCLSVRVEHRAGEQPRAYIEVWASAELVLPKGAEIVRHPLDEMVHRR